MTETTNVISIKNVILKKLDKLILDNITWDVSKGEHWTILGLNGSGKTSLLNILTGYQWASKGEVIVLDKLFGQTNIQELRKSIGFVSATIDDRYQLRPSDTPLEIVLSGKSATVGLYEKVSQIDIEYAEQLLTQFLISHLSYQPYYTLSQGERKRVILARAWMASPQIIILDEPCSGLDLFSREELLSTIQQLASIPNGPTLIYVTHHIEEIIPAISHTLLIRNGAIVASGRKHDILTEPLLMETFQLPVQISWQDERPWVSIKRKTKL